MFAEGKNVPERKKQQLVIAPRKEASSMFPEFQAHENMGFCDL